MWAELVRGRICRAEFVRGRVVQYPYVSLAKKLNVHYDNTLVNCNAIFLRL